MWTPLRVRGRAPYRDRRLLLGALIAGAFPQPSLSLDFTKGVIDPRITCSGGVGGTVMNSSGNIVAASCPRFDYGNPRTNLAKWSTDLTNAVYSKSGGTISKSGIVNKLVEDLNNSVHDVNQQVAIVGTTQTLTVRIAPAGRTWCYLQLGGNSAYFNLATGTTGTVAGGMTANIVPANDGLGSYDCSLSGNVTNTNAIVGTAAGNTQVVYQGDGVSGIYISGFMVENGSVSSPITYGYYVATGATAVTVADPLGLLVEEQRSNLLLNSSDFTQASWVKSAQATITANQAIAPDGTNTAARYDAVAGGNNTLYQSPVVTASANYASTIYLKLVSGQWFRLVFSDGGANQTRVWINLVTGTVGTANAAGTGTFVSAGISSVGNGWYRVSLVGSTPTSPGFFLITATDADASTAQAAGSAYVWGAQLEAGSFATSYIPTTSAAVTRTADTAVISGTNFSNFFNQSAGTVVWEGDFNTGSGATSQPGFFGFVDNPVTNNWWYAQSTSTGQVTVGRRASGVTAATLFTGAGVLTANTVNKVGTSFTVNGTDSLSANGAAIIHAASVVSAIAATQLNLGTFAGNPGPSNGHTKHLRYWPRQLPDATLQRLTH